MTDSHCHLADEVFADELEQVVGRAQQAGVNRALVILAAGDAAEAEQAARLTTLWPEVRLSVGVHPHAAHEFADDPARVVGTVTAQVNKTPAARAIGEIGLDYHYDFSPRDIQQLVFRHQLRVARELERPVVIHTREAEDDTLRILREEGIEQIGGVLHCFTGTPALARAGLDLGLHVSVAGIVTFPKASSLRETVKAIPLDRLLVETDSPFLAPVPHRGKRNEPAFLGRTVESLASLYDVPAAEIAHRTSANFQRLFRP